MSLAGRFTKSKTWRIDAAGAVGPLLDASAEQAAQAKDLDSKTDDAQKEKDAAARLEGRLAAVTEELARRPMRLQPAGMLNQRHAEIARLASETGMEISELQPRPGTRKALYQTIPIHLTGTCTYRTAAAFLHRMHAAFPDMGVASFELTGNPAAPAEGAVFRLELVWYAAPDQA
jgi:Tfp pilus assembly protein PilO